MIPFAIATIYLAIKIPIFYYYIDRRNFFFFLPLLFIFLLEIIHLHQKKKTNTAYLTILGIFFIESTIFFFYKFGLTPNAFPYFRETSFILSQTLFGSDILSQQAFYGVNHFLQGGSPSIFYASANLGILIKPLLAYLGIAGFKLYIFCHYAIFPFLVGALAYTITPSHTLRNWSCFFAGNFFYTIITLHTGNFQSVLSLNFILLTLIIYNKTIKKPHLSLPDYFLPSLFPILLSFHYFPSVAFIYIILFCDIICNYSKQKLKLSAALLSINILSTAPLWYPILIWHSFLPSDTLRVQGYLGLYKANQIVSIITYRLKELYSPTGIPEINHLLAFTPLLFIFIKKIKPIRHYLLVQIILYIAYFILPIICPVDLIWRVWMQRFSFILAFTMSIIISFNLMKGPNSHMKTICLLVLLIIVQYIHYDLTHSFNRPPIFQSFKENFPEVDAFFTNHKDGAVLLEGESIVINPHSEFQKKRMATSWGGIFSYFYKRRTFTTPSQVWGNWKNTYETILLSGRWNNKPLIQSDITQFIAMLDRWGIKYLLINHSDTKNFILNNRDLFQPEIQTSFWDIWTYKNAKPNFLEMPNGSGEALFPDYFTIELRLNHVKEHDHIILKNRYFDAWSAFFDGSSSLKLINSNGRLAFMAPMSGSYTVTLKFPRFPHLYLISTFVFVIMGIISLLDFLISNLKQRNLFMTHYRSK